MRTILYPVWGMGYTYDRRIWGRVDSKKVSLAHKLADKYARILGVDSTPKIVVRDNLGAKWLGRLTWKLGKQNLMELQAGIFEDEETLERVVAHEMVHHAEAVLDYDEQTATMVRMGLKPLEHGKRFHELARKVNAAKGSGFVTEKSDQSYILPAKTKPYFVLVLPWRGGSKFGYAYGVRLSPKMRKFIDRYVKDDQAKLVKTTDPRWVHGPRIGDGRFGVPQKSDDQDRLQALYQRG